MISRPSSDNARRILFISLFAYVAGGALLTYRHWAALRDSQNAMGRAAIFVILVGLLHSAGYSLYRDQQAWARLVPVLRSVIWQHVVILFLCSLILMSGLMQYVTVIAGAYWAAVAIIITRRPRLTRSDLMVIRYGFAAMFLLGMITLKFIA